MNSCATYRPPGCEPHAPLPRIRVSRRSHARSVLGMPLPMRAGSTGRRQTPVGFIEPKSIARHLTDEPSRMESCDSQPQANGAFSNCSNNSLRTIWNRDSCTSMNSGDAIAAADVSFFLPHGADGLAVPDFASVHQRTRGSCRGGPDRPSD